MHLTLRADKDAYITNKIISEQRMTGSNVGEAGTLDLFKLYGMSMSGSTPLFELSRLLVHFDLDPLRTLTSEGKIDTTHSSFRCSLRLKDVYGGQTTPTHFTVVCNPLSRSFNEGIGRDVVQFSDLDVCNYVSASRVQAWMVEGCGSGGYVGESCDYLTASGATNLSTSMFFETGEEDLVVDITDAVRGVLTGSIPDEGFRIALDPSLETNQYSYFVKRFGTRRSYDAASRPAVVVTYNDSIQDDTGLIALDTPLSLVLHNYELGIPANLTSASIALTGSDCVMFKLVVEVSGGFDSLHFLGSQYENKTGVYSASINVPSTNAVVAQKLQLSGAYKPLPVWGSLDGTVAFETGSILTFRRKEASRTFGPNVRYDVGITLPDEIEEGTENIVRVNLFDRDASGRRPSRVLSRSVGAVVRDTHVSIRDITTGETVVPFDKTRGSSKCSSDIDGMWFRLFTHGWVTGHRYVIDVMTSTNGVDTIYRDASTPFKVVVPR